MRGQIVHVALDLPLTTNFDFLGEDVTANDIGRIAIVPFGNKKLAGVIVALSEKTDVPADKLKPVLLVQRALPKFSARDFALFHFCESYYHYPFGPIALSALPPALRLAKSIRPRQQRIVEITPLGREAIEALSARAVAQRIMLSAVSNAPQTESQLKLRHERAASVLTALLKKDLVSIREVPNRWRSRSGDRRQLRLAQH